MDNPGLWAAPLLLIPGVGLLVLSTSARFGQLHEELIRHRSGGQSEAMVHLCRRARLFRDALVSFYVSIAILAAASVVGTLAGRYLPDWKWVAEGLMAICVLAIGFGAMQMIRESTMLLSVFEDNTDED